MSEQVAERLTNSCPNASLPKLEMFGLARSLPPANEGWNECQDWFEYAIAPSDQSRFAKDGATVNYSSALCRGYIGHHELNSDGTLTLLRYEYPSWGTGPTRFDEVNLVVTGDFWLILKEHSHSGETVFLPFLDGEIVVDQTEWVTLVWPPLPR